MNKKAQQSAKTIDRLLAVAGELFMRQGYENTAMEQIAEQCGLTRGALYHHFKSKDGILEALCAKHYDGLYGCFDAIMEDTVSPAVDRLAAFVVVQRGYEDANPAFFKPYLRMHASKDPAHLMLKGRFKQQRKRMYLNFIAPLLDAGRKEGAYDFPVSAETLAVYFLQIEDAITEVMAAIIIDESMGPEAKDKALHEQMEYMAFAFSRLAGTDIENFRKILVYRHGIDHYNRTLG